MAGRASTMAAWHVALPMTIPVIVMLYSVVASVALGRKGAVVVLAVSWVLLLAAAAWLNRTLFGRVRTFLPFAVAVVVVLLVWLWQWLAFVALVPPGGLPYGYFLTAQGAQARFWVLTGPYSIGVGCLSLCCLVAVGSWWRSGAHLSLLCMIPWWLAVFLVFSLPSMDLDWQGNASVFI